MSQQSHFYFLQHASAKSPRQYTSNKEYTEGTQIKTGQLTQYCLTEDK